MPIHVIINGKEIQITPNEVKQTFEFSEEIKTFEVNRNFYIEAAEGSRQEAVRSRQPDKQ